MPGIINGGKFMKPAIISTETAEEIFSFDASDEALEIAAQAKEKSMFTLWACTGLSVCPGGPAQLHLIAFRRDRREAVFLFQ
jgi:hypothetical protein